MDTLLDSVPGHAALKSAGTTRRSNMSISIPKKIVHAIPPQSGDSVEWLWTTEAVRSFRLVLKFTKLLD